MATHDVATEVVIALMGGGIVTAGVNVYNARQSRRTAKTAEAKVPVEINLSSLEGAEKAVLSLGRALDEANRRIDDLEEDLQAKAAELAAVRAECERLREMLDRARRALRLYMRRAHHHATPEEATLLDGLGLDDGS